MSGNGPDPFAPGESADEDLQSELDAWDRTFDALHTSDPGSPGAGAPTTSPATASPPSPAGVVPAPVPPPLLDSDSFAEEEPTRAMKVPRALLDEATTGALPPSRPPTAPVVAPVAAAPTAPVAAAPAASVAEAPTAPVAAVLGRPASSPPRPAPGPRPAAPPMPPELPPPPLAPDLDETDFSDLGFDGSPEALGSLLGLAGAGTPTPTTVPPRPAPRPTPPGRVGFEEDEVFTSAVRPSMLPSLGASPGPSPGTSPGASSDGPVEATRVAPAALYLFEGDQTQERPAVAKADRPTGRGERVARPGPAIVRRDRPTPTVSSSPDVGFEGGETTRVADLSAIERLARSLDEIDEAAAAGPPVVDEEDFPQIEVTERATPALEAAAAVEAAPAPAATAQVAAPATPTAPAPTSPSTPQRKLAHVVRRTSGAAAAVPPTAAPPPVAPVAAEPPALVLEVDDEPVVTAAPPEVALDADDLLAALAAVDEAVPPLPPAAVETAPVAAVEVALPRPPVAVAARAVDEPAPLAAPPVVIEPPVFDDRTEEGIRPDLAALAAPVVADPFADDVSRTKIGVAPVPRPPTTPPRREVDVLAALALDEAEAAVPAAPSFEYELALDEPEPAAAAAAAVASLAEPSPAQESIAAAPAAPAPAPEPEVAPTAQTPTAQTPTPQTPAAARRARVTGGLDPRPELPPARFGDAVPVLDLDRLQLPEQADLIAGHDLSEDAARALLSIERELDRIDEPLQVAALRVEAGRQYERLGDVERARTSYEAALLADPRATAALRGLRRIARGQGDVAEATRWLEVELPLAGPLERRALGLHRVDLLMAAGEQDLARVSVGELIDQAQGDVRAQLAQLELAFLDGRAAELDEALAHLADALTDPALRAATDVARGHLAERAGDRARAVASFSAATQADPTAITGWLGAWRTAGEGVLPILAGLDAQHGDRAIAAGFALRAPGGLSAAAAARGDDPLVVAELVDDAIARAELEPRLLAAAEGAEDPVVRRRAALWAAGRLVAVEAAEADAAAGGPVATSTPDARAARAAQIDRLYRSAQQVLAGDGVASGARVERALASGETAVAAEELAARVRAGAGGLFERTWAASLFAAAGRHDEAMAQVTAALEAGACDPASSDVWSEVAATTGGAAARAALVADVAGRAASEPERFDAKLGAVAVATAADAAAGSDHDALRRAIAAWEQVDEHGGDGERACARILALAATLGDPAVLDAARARAQAAAASPAYAATLALARARAATDPADADARLGDVAADDPRRTATALTAALRRGDWGEVARLHEQRAAAIAGRSPLEAALATYRAAGIYLDRADDPARAVALLGRLVDEHPGLGFAHDLLAAGRRRLGEAAPPRPLRAEGAGRGADAFARLVRDADEVTAQGDLLAALGLLGKALELRPGDPLAAEPLARLAREAREAGPVAALALAELRQAEASGEPRAIADAYEELAAIDRDLRGDAASALISLDAAAGADPGRQPVLRALERAHAQAGRTAELAAVRARQLESLAADGERGPDDLAALALDRAALLEQLERPPEELRAAYQAVVDRAPRARRALFHLEALVRREGASPALLALEDAAADYFAADPRSRAAFLTRAGDTLAELGRRDEAIARYRAADALRPARRSTLDGWRDAALAAEQWEEVAAAAAASAGAADDPAARAAYWHLAGVVLMDKAHAGERAADAFRAALAAAPRHTDAFLRLRLLHDEHGEHDALAELLERRLEVEDDAGERLALHRAIAELARNFLEDRERAKLHYRALVEAAPSDTRAVAALSDIAWEQGDWPAAAQTLRRRAELERDPVVLHHIHFRLGMIYAERLPDPAEAITWFQRVLLHDPDDEAALERVADLAILIKSWKLALSACERLVKHETVPARKVAHLHRVGRIFSETNQRQRAERAYQLAVDAAPDSEIALAALVRFYEDAGDTASIRVHLGLVAASMRARATASASTTGPDGDAFRVLARIARAREQAGVLGQAAVARAAADISRLLGAEPDVDVAPRSVHVGALVRPEADELLWPPAVIPELRQIFSLLGDRLAKHVGVDLRPYGVTRGDRLRPRENPVGGAAQEVATAFGLGEIDIYISQRQPLAMVAEPTSPPSLILGSAIAERHREGAVRFAAAGALKHIASHTAIPARLSEDELGVLMVALLRIFQPDFPYLAVDADAVIVQLQKLRRLIPSNLVAELRPYAMAIAPSSLDHRALARGLAAVTHRAGLVAAGGALTPLQIVMARAGVTELAAGLAVPSIAELVAFAISDDHGNLAALATP